MSGVILFAEIMIGSTRSEMSECMITVPFSPGTLIWPDLVWRGKHTILKFERSALVDLASKQ